MSLQEILKKHNFDFEKYEKVYKDLHANPGLSKTEEYAHKVASEHLEKLGYKVTKNIGGYGLIGVLENGEGKTIMARADTDALPVEELTGLDYASKVRQQDPFDGVEKPVMHACGHDMHITWLMAVAEFMVNVKGHWNGTFVAIFQPAEESGSGARAMIADGLYEKDVVNCPIPDIVLSQHVLPFTAGNTYLTKGVAFTTADSLQITIHGKGAHSSQPSSAVNPVIIAAHSATQIQEITSTFVGGADTVVCTVTCIQGGQAPNVIPDHAEIKVNVRTTSTENRETVIAAIKRVVESQCKLYGAPIEPEFKNIVYMPLLENDDDTTDVVSKVFNEHFGERHSDNPPKIMGSEDCSELSKAVNKPITYWFVGGTDPEVIKKSGGKPPFNHSSDFAPVTSPTIKTGYEAMSIAVLAHLGQQ